MAEANEKPLGMGAIIAIMIAVGLGVGVVLGLVGGLVKLPPGVTGGAVGGAVGVVGVILLNRRRALIKQQNND